MDDGARERLRDLAVRSVVAAGYEVPPFYDSLLGKLIVWGETREIALARSRRALAEIEIGGVRTNVPFHRGIIENDAFVDARVSTNLLDRVGPGAFVAG
jgi:biotin carboxylase